MIVDEKTGTAVGWLSGLTEVAAYTSRSRKYLLNWVKSGKLTGRGPKRNLFSVTEVDEAIRASTPVESLDNENGSAKNG